MKKWIVTILAVAALVLLAFYARIWLPAVLPLLRSRENADLLKSVTSIVQIALWIGGGLAFIINLWRGKKNKDDRSEAAAPPAGPPPALPQPPPEKTSALRQLPAPPADFTGRAEELNELLVAVKIGGVAISGLQGLGGVGKTALALKLADHLKADYPDAHLYLDLKGAGPQPVSPRDAMAHVVRAWHPTEQLPEKEEEVTPLYLSLLSGKRVLLLMDNARDAEQVAPLLPPAGCLLLVTSRKHFTLPGLVEKNLDKLPPADARELLVRIAKRLKKEKPEAVDELAGLCGYLPLALRAVASALHAKRNISAAEYAQRLQEAGKHLVLEEIDPSLQKSLGAVLRSSYDLLPAELRQRFRSLFVFPDSFDLTAAAAVWKALRASAQDSLGELLAYSLLDFDETTRRYRLHDLVRLFVGQLLNEDERYTAAKRHAGHYLQAIKEANDLYKKGGESVTQGLALFDAEWTNIQTGHEWVIVHQRDDNNIADWCARYPLTSPRCLGLRQHPREIICWLEPALAATRRMKQRQWESAALGNLGLMYARLGEYRRAIEYHEQALAITKELDDRLGESQDLGNLGNAYDSLGEYRRAIEYHEQALAIDKELGDRLGESQDLGSLGNTYNRLGEYRRAIEYQEQALAIDKELGYRLGEGHDLGSLGNAYHSLGEYRRAIEFHEQYLKIAREIGERLGEGQALGNLGNAYRALGEYRRAIDHCQQQLQIAREIGDRLGEANSLFNSALTLDQLGDRLEAIARAEAALKIYEAIEAPDTSYARDQLAKWRGEAKARGQGSAG